MVLASLREVLLVEERNLVFLAIVFWDFASFRESFDCLVEVVFLLLFSGRFGVLVLINLGDKSSITPSSTFCEVRVVKLT